MPSPSQRESSHFIQVRDISARDKIKIQASVLQDWVFVNHLIKAAASRAATRPSSVGITQTSTRLSGV